ncbi:MAG: hypothetical protein WBA44_04975 [Mesorhizobium sp.]
MAQASRVRPAQAIIFAAMLAGIAGCQTGGVDGLMPLEGTRNTGTYPDLNVKPQAETAQLTTGEAEQEVARLKAAKASQVASSGGTPPVSQSEFRSASGRQKQVLKAIEAGD